MLPTASQYHQAGLQLLTHGPLMDLPPMSRAEEENETGEQVLSALVFKH